MNSKQTLLILDVLKSLDVHLSDSVMTETCSRQTTTCSRQACSSSDQRVRINLLYIFYVKSVNSQYILIVLDVLESLEVIVFDSVIVEACSRQTTGCSSSDHHLKPIYLTLNSVLTSELICISLKILESVDSFLSGVVTDKACSRQATACSSSD